MDVFVFVPGQLKLGRAGQYCLSQSGSEAGVENVAEKAGVVASSVADAVAHGASMAVDGRSTTFWASSPSDSVRACVRMRVCAFGCVRVSAFA